MNLSQNIKDKIQRLYDDTPDNIHSVSWGYKTTGGKKTNDLCIIFKVKQKIPKQQLSQEDLLPEYIKVDGQNIKTDVVESRPVKHFTCYANTSFTPTTSYDSNDENVLRLRGVSSATLYPMRGGQEIIQFPTGFAGSSTTGYTISLGTVGFFCTDNYDDRIVGVTNSHVLIANRQIASERNLVAEKTFTYNIYEDLTWIVDGKKYPPGVLTLDNGSSASIIGRLKRYMPVTDSGSNYVDCALYTPTASSIGTDSYKIWQPIDTPDYNSIYTFATTSELDELLTTYKDVPIYSTGRTTGPKGYGSSPSCQLHIVEIGSSINITYDDGTSNSWSDLIVMEYLDFSSWPAAPGDSGSAILADINGTRKIIGLLFAGNDKSVYICRIDKVSKDMNIRPWDPLAKTSTATAFLVTIDPTDPNANNPTLVQSGRTYYQAGFTSNTYPSAVSGSANIPTISNINLSLIEKSSLSLPANLGANTTIVASEIPTTYRTYNIDNSILKGTIPKESYGISTAITNDGSTLVVGAYMASITFNGNLYQNAGAIYIYNKINENWVLRSKIYNPKPIAFEHFGTSLAISSDGSYLFIGAIGSNHISGHVYYAERDGSSGNYTIKSAFSNLLGEEPTNWGFSVTCSGDGNIVAFGAPSWNNKTQNQTRAGAVTIYTRDSQSTNWNRLKTVTLDEDSSNFGFGASVSLSDDGNYLAVGNDRFDNAKSQASIMVFKKVGSDYVTFDKIKDDSNKRSFGRDVTLTGDGHNLLTVSEVTRSNSNSATIYSILNNKYVLSQRMPVLLTGAKYTSCAISKDASLIILGSSEYNSGYGISRSGAIFSCVQDNGTTKSYQLDNIYESPVPADYDLIGNPLSGVNVSGDGSIIVSSSPTKDFVLSFKAGKSTQRLHSKRQKGFGVSCSFSNNADYLTVSSYDSITTGLNGTQSYTVDLFKRNGNRLYESLGRYITTSKPSQNLYNPLKMHIPPCYAHDKDLKSIVIGSFKNNSIIIANRDQLLSNGTLSTPTLNDSIKGRGASVSMTDDGLSLAVGCIYADGINQAGSSAQFTGATEVYERVNINSHWYQVGTFKPYDLVANPSKKYYPLFGRSVSICGSIGSRLVAVGAPNANEGKGVVYIQNFDERVHGQAAIFRIDGADHQDSLNFGMAVSIYNDDLSGSIVLIAGDAKRNVYFYTGSSFSALTFNSSYKLKTNHANVEYSPSIGISNDANRLALIGSIYASGDGSETFGGAYLDIANAGKNVLNYKTILNPAVNDFTGYQTNRQYTSEGSSKYLYTNIKAIGSPNHDAGLGVTDIFFE